MDSFATFISESTDIYNIHHYFDSVEKFDLLYKITPSTEKIDPIMHYHECFEVILYSSANLEAFLDSKHYTLTSHDILLIPPRKMHRLNYFANQHYVRYVFYFALDTVEKAFGPTNQKKAMQFFINPTFNKVSLLPLEYQRISNLFQNMYVAKQGITPAYSYLTQTYGSIILQELFLAYNHHKVPVVHEHTESPLELILDYINENYSSNITLEELSKKFYLNKSYICRIFQKSLGISLVNYIQNKRILEAQQQLLNSEKSIIDIALDCGFNNVQHFYRVFKKLTHVTPKEYKKQQLHSKLGESLFL